MNDRHEAANLEQIRLLLEGLQPAPTIAGTAAEPTPFVAETQEAPSDLAPAPADGAGTGQGSRQPK